MRPLGPGHCLRWHSQEEVELKFKSRLYMVCQGKEAFKKGVKSE